MKLLLILFGVLILLVPNVSSQLVSERTISETFFETIEEERNGLTSSYKIFQINNPFGTMYLRDLKSKMIIPETVIISDYDYYLQKNRLVSVPTYDWIYYPETCENYDNTTKETTYYDCSYYKQEISGSTNEIVSDWELITEETTIGKGKHKIKIQVNYPANIGKKNIEWIPELDMKSTEYPELAKDLKLDKKEWAWFVVDWDYKIPITIDPVNQFNASDVYHVSINTTELYEAGKIRSDCGDVRFTNESETDTLPYYYETCNVTGGNTTFYAKIDQNYTSQFTIYMYYGSPLALSEANGYETFLFFDDFSGDSSQWDLSQGVFNISNGILTSDAGAGQHSYARSSIENLTNPLVWELKMRHNSGQDLWNFLNSTTSNDFFRYSVENTGTMFWIRAVTGGTWSGSNATQLDSITLDQWYELRCEFVDSLATCFRGRYMDNFNKIDDITIDGGSFGDFNWALLFYQDQNGYSDWDWTYAYTYTNYTDSIGAEETEPTPPTGNVTIIVSNISVNVEYDPASYDYITRSYCANSEELVTTTRVEECINDNSGNNTNCYWFNRTRLTYCQNGCYDNVSENGAMCSPVEYMIYVYGIIIFIVSAAVISWVFRGKGRRR